MYLVAIWPLGLQQNTLVATLFTNRNDSMFCGKTLIYFNENNLYDNTNLIVAKNIIFSQPSF